MALNPSKRGLLQDSTPQHKTRVFRIFILRFPAEIFAVFQIDKNRFRNKFYVLVGFIEFLIYSGNIKYEFFKILIKTHFLRKKFPLKIL